MVIGEISINMMDSSVTVIAKSRASYIPSLFLQTAKFLLSAVVPNVWFIFKFIKIYYIQLKKENQNGTVTSILTGIAATAANDNAITDDARVIQAIVRDAKAAINYGPRRYFESLYNSYLANDRKWFWAFP